MAIPKIPKTKVGTALGGSVAGVKAPSGIAKPITAPMIDRRLNVGASNVSKIRWQSGKPLGNHK
jgi:hypothetical protein